MKSTFKKVLGVILIIVGVIALITPLTPGSWLLFVGLGLLGVKITFWEKWKNWHERMAEINRENEADEQD